MARKDPESNRAYFRERYRTRKANRRCIWCNAGLQDDDLSLCVECKERRRISAKNWRTRNRPRLRKYQRARRERQIEKYRQRIRTMYLRRKLRGQCVKCTERALEDSVHCEKHRELDRRNSREYQRRKNGSAKERRKVAGIRARKRRIRELRARWPKVFIPMPERAKPANDGPADAELHRSTVRLLAQLRFMEWPNAGEILDALGVPGYPEDPTEYNRWLKTLERAVTNGLVEQRRRARMLRDYRITDKGLAIVREAQANARRAA